jgi:hypothetical protein
MDERTKTITLDYLWRKENRRPIPAWLTKQIKGIWMITTKPDDGIILLKEGLQDQRDYITELLAGNFEQ